MRLSDEDFAALALSHDFEEYYSLLSADEMVDELSRLHTSGHKLIALHQHLSMHKRFTDLACFDHELAEHQRSAVIGIATNLRDTLDKVIIPEIDEQTANRVRAALAATDDYLNRFGYYPRAVEMIRIGARDPHGPYELGPIGEILS